MASHMAIISNDSPSYMYEAQIIEDRGFLEFFSTFDEKFSIYPIFIHIFHYFVQDYVFAGQLVSIVFGCLLFFSIFFFTKAIFDSKTALIAVFLVSVHPLIARYSAEVLKDSTLYFFLFTALSFFIVGIKEKKSFFVFFAGIFAWTAILVRIFGIILIPTTVVAYLVYAIVRKSSVKTTIFHLIIYLLPAPVIGVSIFMLMMGTDAFQFFSGLPTVIHLLAPKDIDIFNSRIIESVTHVSPFYLDMITNHFYWICFIELNSVIITTFSLLYIILFLAGIYFDRNNIKGSPVRIFLLALSIVFIGLIYYMVTAVFFTTKRQIVILLLLLTPWMSFGAIGLLEVIRYILEETIRRFWRRSKTFKTEHIFVCVALIWFVIIFIYSFIPYRAKYGYMKEVGDFIYDTNGPGATIMLHEYNTRILFYADGQGEYYTSTEDAEKAVLRSHPDYIVWDTRLGPKTEEFDSIIDRNGYGLFETWEGKAGNIVYIYNKRSQ